MALLAVGVRAAVPPEHPARRPAAAHWVGSWAVAPLDFLELASNPLAATATAPGPGGPAFRGQTLRQQLRPALGGERIRIRFSNRFGKLPMHIAAASVGRSSGADAVSAATLRVLHFGGRGSLTLAPGAEAWSDGVELEVEAGQAVAVSAFFDRATPFATVHLLLIDTSWVAPGNAVAAPRLQGATGLALNHIVTGLDVWTTRPVRTVVAFGDSITAGEGEAGNGAYPEMLAARLRESLRNAQGAQAVSVLNTGIGGNRLLVDGIGPSGLSRFARDALGQSGVTHVIVLLGTNDIGRSVFSGGPGAPAPDRETPTAQRITDGLQRLIGQARAKGIEVLVGTVPPFGNTLYWTQDTEAMRSAVNRWIRGRQDIAGVIDFDAALRNPEDPLALNPRYDSGDHLHPNKAGHAAMAAAIDWRTLRE